MQPDLALKNNYFYTAVQTQKSMLFTSGKLYFRIIRQISLSIAQPIHIPTSPSPL